MIEKEKFKIAYANFMEDKENYTASLLYHFLDCDNIEELQEIYDIYINSSMSLFSEELQNKADRLHSAKIEAANSFLKEIVNQIGYNIDINLFLESFNNNLVVKKYKIECEYILFNLKEIEENYVVIFNDNKIMVLLDYIRKYDVKIRNKKINSKEIYIVTIYDDNKYLGRFIKENISEADTLRYKYGFLYPEEVTSNLKTPEEEKKDLYRIYINKFYSFVRLFSDMQISKNFNYKKEKTKIMNKYLLEYNFINNYILKFMEYLFEGKPKEDILEINYLDYLEFELRQMLRLIEKEFLEIKGYLQKYNMSTESYELIKERNRKKLY